MLPKTTGSSAVADRPCDNISCLSVGYKTSSAIFYYWLLRLHIYRCVQFNSIFCSVLFVMVVHAGCDKQDSLMRGGLCGNCTVDRRSCCSHCSSHRSIASCSSRIAICAFLACILRPVRESPSYCHDVWYRKTRMVIDGSTRWWKKVWEYVYSFRQNSRTWQTERQTDTAGRHRPRLCIASRGKNSRF